MEKLFQAVYGGILYGSIYGLMAIGLTLIWGSLRMLNLAHGALYLVGGYLAWTALKLWDLPPLLAFALGITAAALIGPDHPGPADQPPAGQSPFFNAAMIATVGAAIMIDSAALLIYGPRVKQMPPIINGQFKVLGVVIQYQGLVIIAVAAISLVLLSLFLKKTRYGLAIQAVSQQMDAARLMGIPTVLTFMIVMAISAALAGLAGSAALLGVLLRAAAGFNPMVKALVVTIFGGLGSVKGTIWAAYIIGVARGLPAGLLRRGLGAAGPVPVHDPDAGDPPDRAVRAGGDATAMIQKLLCQSHGANRHRAGGWIRRPCPGQSPTGRRSPLPSWSCWCCPGCWPASPPAASSCTSASSSSSGASSRRAGT